MCHVIQKENSCFLKFKNFLVGLKEISYERDRLFPAYIKGNYKITKLNGLYCLSARAKKQDLNLKFRIKNHLEDESDYIFKTIKIKAGIHISSFSKSMYEDIFSLDQTARIPVLFSLKDLIFWDGDVVSVKRFFLPNEEMIKKLLKEKELFEFRKNFADDYKLIIEIAEKQFQKQNKKEK